ncbi:hypothetical protein BST97_02825 [Nonlabens spongiae]|uniref:EF-hand domain-containing protein n=1 Tax=Nonlabens spongiae TaxID=331648 RepID=A0A1W6MHG3_9FLAO|nr:hypothetical protein [Nonlabens spongiae]ARN77017.1 hypothetical protein BST97_02825 [Nonlabens spongiae]
MKRIHFFCLFILFNSTCFAQNIQFSSAELKSWILNNPTVLEPGWGFTMADLNNDGEISVYEGSRITHIRRQRTSVTPVLLNDFTDLLNFPLLEWLDFGTDLTQVDLNSIPDLEYLYVEFNNQINSSLDISDLSSLIRVEAKFENNNVSNTNGISLNVSGLQLLEGLRIHNYATSNIDFNNLPNLS